MLEMVRSNSVKSNGDRSKIDIELLFATEPNIAKPFVFESRIGFLCIVLSPTMPTDGRINSGN